MLKKKTLLVTGGAGFIGSHLTDRLIGMGARVIVIDNFITGNQKNLSEALVTGTCELITADVATVDLPEVEGIFHLASPASPVGYGKHPVETYKANAFATHRLAEYAATHRIPLLFTSTSEAYGDPLEHPQKESYWGHVNPVGPRACYDESKRFGEMVVSTWARNFDLDGRIVRIFNTYGPRMDPCDGRVIPNFITQALKQEPISIYGNGSQTRSFCYVDDLVEFIIRAFTVPEARGEVINIGNPDEYSMIEFAQKIRAMTKSNSDIVYKPLPPDDPTRRRPDISKAKRILGYSPQTSLEKGLKQTIEWFKSG